MAHISDRLPEPFDRKLIISWNKLTSKSKNTLWRALERSDIWDDSFVEGFNFELMSKISIEELNDARFRVKKKIDSISDSRFREQKSYAKHYQMN